MMSKSGEGEGGGERDKVGVAQLSEASPVEERKQ